MAFMYLKKFILLSLTLILSNLAIGKDMREERPWFINKNCHSLTIKKYKSISNHKIVAEVSIADTNVVKKIVERIEKIPANGDMMVSFGPDAQHTELIFSCETSGPKDSPHAVIEIYQKGFKTPSTGFNSDGNEIEKKLQADIAALLEPTLNTKILKIENLELKFENFSITYKGHKTTNAPVTASFTTETYLIKDKKGQEQSIQVTSGQTAPQTQKFEVNKKAYSLLPLKSSQGEDLLPDYFEISQ